MRKTGFFAIVAVIAFLTLAPPFLGQEVTVQGQESSDTEGQETVTCTRQQSNPSVLICPPTSGARSTSAGGDGFDWVVFQAVWISALIGLFIIFRWNRNNKLLVREPGKEKSEKDEKDKEPPEPLMPKWRMTLVIILSMVLGVSFLITLSSGSWLEIAALLGVWIAIVLYHWPQVAEIWKSVKNAWHSSGAGPITLDMKTTFKDVGGLDDIIEELQEVVNFYKDTKEAEAWGIRPTSGILLVGPAGCGKTLIAAAVAGEANIKFLAYSAAEFGSSYVRSGSQDIKYAFANAAASTPCVIFIDEIDALGRKRGYDSSGEFDHALTELLHEMDGVRKRSGVLVLAATNREDILDEALLRPGRFDKKIVIPHPDVNGREQILKIHTAKKPLDHDVNLREFAERTPGFSGAALEQTTNEAAQLARRRFEEERKRRGAITAAVDAAKEFFAEPERIINKADFEEGILRVQLGPARKLVMNENERRIVAQHEIGHAIVTAEKGLEILDKVTLMPRNWALGLTESHSEESNLLSKHFLMARITSLLGGRAAEEVFLGKDRVTTGAGNDFEKAAELTRKMVCEWGMGELGPAVFHKLGSTFPGQNDISEHTAKKIDQEVEKIISKCLADAVKIVITHKETAGELAEQLIVKGVLHAKEITDTLKERRAEK